jgi:hypothetical protein
MAIEITQNLTQVTISSVGVQGPKGEAGPAGASADSSALVTTSSFNEFTSSYTIDSASFADRINAATNEQDLSVFTTTSSFNEFTSSIQSEVNSIKAWTASLELINTIDTELLQFYQTTASLNTQTGSQDLVNLSISSVTGSINSTTSSLIGITNELMAYTSSNESWKDGIRGEISALEAWTSSLELINTTDVELLELYQATRSLEIQTGSQQLINDGISAVTGAFSTELESIDIHILGVSTQTASQDSVNLGISTFSGSIRDEISGIETYTSSLKGAIEISGQDVNVLGMLTAQQFNVTYVSSSTLFQSGSTKFGDTSDDVHTFTGTINLNGLALGTSELMAQTASQDSVNIGISAVTGAFATELGGIQTTLSGHRIELDGLEAYTSSLRTALSVTESMVHFNSAITASVVSSSYIKFDSLPDGTAPSYQEGLLYYDNDMGALTFYNNKADISLQIGQEQYIRAINKSGDDILNGTPVRVSGSQGDKVKIYKAEAFIHTGSYNVGEAENHIVGITTHDILNDEDGYVTIAGLVKGIDTSNYNAGDILYIQTGSAGVLTNSAPPFPYDKIQVGIVGRKHASVGEVLVLPKEPTHFGNITGLSGSLTTEVGDLWVYKSNNAWATSKTLEGDYTITGSLDIVGSGSLNGDNIVSSNTIMKIETISSASYAALTPPVSGTLYIII